MSEWALEGNGLTRRFGGFAALDNVSIVEHDMEVIFSICSHLTMLHLGHILAEGTPEEVRAMPEVITAYLGSSVA